jgi:hypothetical protein
MDIDYTDTYYSTPGNFLQLPVPIPFSDQGFTFYMKMVINGDTPIGGVLFSRHGPYYGYVPPNYVTKLQKTDVGTYTLSIRQNYNYNTNYAVLSIADDTETELYFWAFGNAPGSTLGGTLNGAPFTFLNDMGAPDNTLTGDSPYIDSVYTYIGGNVDDDGNISSGNFSGTVYRFYTSSFYNPNVVTPTSNVINALWGPFDLANTNTQYTVSSNLYYSLNIPTDYSADLFLKNEDGISFFINITTPQDPSYSGELFSLNNFKFSTTDIYGYAPSTTYDIFYTLYNTGNDAKNNVTILNGLNQPIRYSNDYYSTSVDINSQWVISNVCQVNSVKAYDKLYSEFEFLNPTYKYNGPSVTNELTVPVYGEYIDLNMKRVVTFNTRNVNEISNTMTVYNFYGTKDAITYTKDAEQFSQQRLIIKEIMPASGVGYALWTEYGSDSKPTGSRYLKNSDYHTPVGTASKVVIHGYIRHTGDFPVTVNYSGEYSINVNGTIFISNGTYTGIDDGTIQYTATFIHSDQVFDNVLDFGGVDFFPISYQPEDFVTNRIEYIPSQADNPVTMQYTKIQTYPQFNITSTDYRPYPTLTGITSIYDDLFQGTGWSNLYGSDPLGQLVYDAYITGTRTINVSTTGTVNLTWPNGNVATINNSSVVDTNGIGLYKLTISCTDAPSFIQLDGLGTDVYALALAPDVTNVYYTLITDDGEINGVASNVLLTNMVSYFSAYSNINYVRLTGKTTNSNCTTTCSTSSIMTVNGVDVGFSSDGQPFFSDYDDGSQLYNYTIIIDYDPALVFILPDFTTYALVDNSINYTKIPVTLDETISNTYTVPGHYLPPEQHFGANTVITGNVYIFDNTASLNFDTDGVLTVQLNDTIFDNYQALIDFAEGTYVSANVFLQGATYFNVGEYSKLFGPPSTILFDGIATPDFTNQGRYIMNIYNGYFSNPNTPAIFNYYGGDHIQNYHVRAFNGDVKIYDVTVLNLTDDQQYFTLQMSDDTNVQDITFTSGDLIEIPNFYESNTAIGNYKTATL